MATEYLISEIKEMAAEHGVDLLDIRALSEVDNDGLLLIDGYPLEKMRDNFSWVISMGIKIPAYPTGHHALQDNENYLKAALKVRLSIAAYDIAAKLDKFGYEAMQDWMSIGNIVFADSDDLDLSDTEYQFSSDEKRPLPLKERYKAAADTTAGVQRESQSMTAGAQNHQTGRNTHDAFISCSVICEAPLRSMNVKLETQQSAEQFLGSIPELVRVQHLGVVPVEKCSGLDDMIDFDKTLPGARNVVALLAEIPPYLSNLAGKQEAECATSYSYLQYETLRELIWAANDLSHALQAEGNRALVITDPTLTSTRTLAPYWEFSWSKLGHPDPRAGAPLAAAAGLGEIGNSGMLLAPEIGPNHKVVYVVTDADLTETQAYQGEKLCIDCGKCAATCPAKALCEKNASGIYKRNEAACEWTRSLGMNSAAGSGLIGWQTPDAEAPENIDVDTAIQAFKSKDPLQVQGYLYPCQIDTVAEACIINCPAGQLSRS